MTDYVTTNIRLPKAMHERVKRLALSANKSLAQIVRESLAEYLITAGTQGQAAVPGEEQDIIFSVGKLTRPGEVVQDERPTDTSVRHDYYLYGLDVDELLLSGGTDE